MSKDLMYQLGLAKLSNHLANQQMTNEQQSGHFYFNDVLAQHFALSLSVIFERNETEVEEELKTERLRKYDKQVQQYLASLPHSVKVKVLHLTQDAGPFPITFDLTDSFPRFLHELQEMYVDASTGTREAAEKLFDKGYYLEVAYLYQEDEKNAMRNAYDLTQFDEIIKSEAKVLEVGTTTPEGVIKFRYKTPFNRSTGMGDIFIIDTHDERKYYVVAEERKAKLFRMVTFKDGD